MAAQIQDVKDAAANRWGELFIALGGMADSNVNGVHGPCPQCGGRDRFRVTSNEVGSAICNQCGKFGDGIAVLEWITGKSTFDVVEMIAERLEVKSTSKAKAKRTVSKKTAAKSNSKPKKREEPYWSKHIVWGDKPRKLINVWLSRKSPIKDEALARANAKFGTYRGKDSVIALPITGEDGSEIGYAIYNATGGTLEYYAAPDVPPEFIKVKNLVPKGESGFMGRYLPGEGLVIKTEGPTDMLALLSIVPDDVSVICNPHGAKETPPSWLVDKVEGREVWTIHDCDSVGQEGATYVENKNRMRPGWAVAFARKAKESRNVVLPYEITENHGKDLRDWIQGQFHSGLSAEQVFDSLKQLAASSEIQQIDETEDEIVEAIDNPSRLARRNLERYESKFGGTLKFWKDEWWRYKGGKYSKLSNSEIEAKIHTSVRIEFEEDYLTRKRNGDDVDAVRAVNIGLVRNVVAATKEKCLLPGSINQPCWLEDESSPHWVSVQNGILDLHAIFEGRDVSEHLRPHSSQWFSSTQLAYQYDPSATCPKWMDYLDYVMEGDGERIMILQEWAGYLLTSTNYLQRFLALYGDGSNGKSVFFGAMIAMVGSDNVGHVPLENFGGRFDLGTLVGKTANICGDVGEIDSVSEGILKQFTGGDPMQFDRKGIAPLICRPTAKLMLSFNNPPKIKDKSKGIWRRMMLIPFNKTVEASRMVRHMDSPEFWIDSGEVSGILNWAIQGLQRLRDQREFTRSAASDEAMESYRRENNPILDFFEEFIESKDNEKIRINHMYDLYKTWCDKSGFRPLSIKSMGVEVKRKFGDIKSRSNSGNREWNYSGLKFRVEEICGKKTDDSDGGYY